MGASWKCPGCGWVYVEQIECPTCHTRGRPYTSPVEITIEGTDYLVQRQDFSPITVMRTDGARLLAGERHLVLSAFLAQQHV